MKKLLLLSVLLMACESVAPKVFPLVQSDIGSDLQLDAGINQIATATSKEVCDNNFDDDGDGQVDENCPCTLGAKKACFPGPLSTVIAEKSICKMGEQACKKIGFEESIRYRWGECIGAALSVSESCDDGLDQDCDGKDLLCPSTCVDKDNC